MQWELLFPWDSCSSAEQVDQEATVLGSWKMQSHSWLAVSHFHSRAEPWGQREWGDFPIPETRICLRDKEGLLGQSNHAEANSLKYCMAPSKEDFCPSSLLWSRPGFTEGSSVWKTFPSPLNWPWTQLEVPTTQLRQRERNVAGPGAGAGMFYSSCVSATAGHVPPLQELNHPTHPFLSFTHVTKAQPECTRIYYKSELKRFAESPGFTLASLHLSMSFSIKIHFLLKTMTWSLNFATSKQTYKR